MMTASSSAAPATTAICPSSKNEGKNGEGRARKKRRLSRKERKQLKKQNQRGVGRQVGAPSSSSSDGTMTTTTTSSVSGSTSSRTGQTDEKKIEWVNSIQDEWFRSTYIPTPLPSSQHDDKGITPTTTTTTTSKSSSYSLGKWFPKARVMKSRRSFTNSQATTAKASLVLFYQYTDSHDGNDEKKNQGRHGWDEETLQRLTKFLEEMATRRVLGGRIRIAKEGVNATLSSVDDVDGSSDDGGELMTARETLRHVCLDLKRFDPIAFSHTDFKFIDNVTADRHFKDFKIIPVQELVYYGFSSSSSKSTGDDGTNMDEATPPAHDGDEGGIHVDAHKFHEMLKQPDTVVIDVRNHYEAAIGRFDGQLHGRNAQNNKDTTTGKAENEVSNDLNMKISTTPSYSTAASSSSLAGATYLDPKMRKSTDFPKWLEQPSTQAQLKNKTILMFCTGGIRCEKASVHVKATMKQNNVDEKQQSNKCDQSTSASKKTVDSEHQDTSSPSSNLVAKGGVYQLKGGIERYLQAFPDGGYWRGKNFVFDKREAISASNPNGDGGVLLTNGAAKASGSHKMASIMVEDAKCCLCDTPWDRYVGKKKCTMCGVPVLMCPKCLSQDGKQNKKKDLDKAGTFRKAKGESSSPILRCPLCVEQNVTVPATELELTDNGVKAAARSSNKKRSLCDVAGLTNVKVTDPAFGKKSKQDENFDNAKAAPSVLKWGGGHAKTKKMKKKAQRRPCQFGSHCTRPDCFFWHPKPASRQHGNVD